MNDRYVNFMDVKNLAIYLAQLTREGVAYHVIKETDGSFSVLITGF